MLFFARREIARRLPDVGAALFRETGQIPLESGRGFFQGRQPLDTENQGIVVTIRMTARQREQFRALGGAMWARKNDLRGTGNQVATFGWIFLFGEPDQQADVLGRRVFQGQRDQIGELRDRDFNVPLLKLATDLVDQVDHTFGAH